MTSEQFDFAKATSDFAQAASTGFRVDLSDKSIRQNCIPASKSQSRDSRAKVDVQAGLNFDANGGLTAIDFGNPGCAPSRGRSSQSSKSTRVEVHADLSAAQANASKVMANPCNPWDPARVMEQASSAAAGFGASISTSETDVTRDRSGRVRNVHQEKQSSGFDVNVGAQSAQRETTIPGNPWLPAVHKTEQTNSMGASAKATTSSSETDISRHHGGTSVHHAEQKSTTGVGFGTGNSHTEFDRRGGYLPAVHQTSDQSSMGMNWGTSTQRQEVDNRYNQFGWLTDSRRIDEGSSQQGAYQANSFRVVTDQAMRDCWGTSTARRVEQGNSYMSSSASSAYRVINDYGPIRRVF